MSIYGTNGSKPRPSTKKLKKNNTSTTSNSNSYSGLGPRDINFKIKDLKFNINSTKKRWAFEKKQKNYSPSGDLYFQKRINDLQNKLNQVTKQSTKMNRTRSRSGGM